jgi:hypothetical protein
MAWGDENKTTVVLLLFGNSLSFEISSSWSAAH